eukprot:10873111-Alexandrium_andersonii.AAC.1
MSFEHIWVVATSIGMFRFVACRGSVDSLRCRLPVMPFVACCQSMLDWRTLRMRAHFNSWLSVGRQQLVSLVAWLRVGQVDPHA